MHTDGFVMCTVTHIRLTNLYHREITVVNIISSEQHKTRWHMHTDMHMHQRQHKLPYLVKTPVCVDMAQ